MSEGGSELCWDHEECPEENCGGELQQQDRFNVMCLSCRSVWGHVSDQERHYLVTEDGVTEAEKPKAVTDGGVSRREEREVLRVLTCGHGRDWVSSSLSRVWCRRCDDMVDWVRGSWSLLGVEDFSPREDARNSANLHTGGDR